LKCAIPASETGLDFGKSTTGADRQLAGARCVVLDVETSISTA
jgi:hypothetical protein